MIVAVLFLESKSKSVLLFTFAVNWKVPAALATTVNRKMNVPPLARPFKLYDNSFNVSTSSTPSLDVRTSLIS